MKYKQITFQRERICGDANDRISKNTLARFFSISNTYAKSLQICFDLKFAVINRSAKKSILFPAMDCNKQF